MDGTKILSVMNSLEKNFKDPAQRWQALKQLVRMQVKAEKAEKAVDQPAEPEPVQPQAGTD